MLYNRKSLSEIVCTRISHDLIGNIGALSGALELIKDNNNILDEDTLQIISTATETLKARQKFFRIAFGTDNSCIELPELQTICTDYLATVGSHNNSITLQTQGITSKLAKLLCLSVMTAAEVYIKGGLINICVNQQNMKIELQSDYKLAANKIEAYQKILNKSMPEENLSQYVQLLCLLETIGDDVAVKLEHTENSMALTIG